MRTLVLFVLFLTGTVLAVMQIEYLSCKEPHQVRDELRGHLLAYTLIGQMMLGAAIGAGV